MLLLSGRLAVCLGGVGSDYTRLHKLKKGLGCRVKGLGVRVEGAPVFDLEVVRNSDG